MTANTYKPGQITALYARLSQEDTLEGDSNSIVNQEERANRVKTPQEGHRHETVRNTYRLAQT